MTATATPRHGALRNVRTETVESPPVALVEATTGRTVYTGPVASHSFTVAEQYCRRCGWIEVRGLLGALLFAHDHEHGEQP